MKSIRFVPREWKWSYLTTIFACSVIAIALPLLLNLMRPTFLEPIELWTVDLRFQHRPPLPVSDDPSQDLPTGSAGGPGTGASTPRCSTCSANPARGRCWSISCSTMRPRILPRTGRWWRRPKRPAWSTIPSP